MIMQNHKILIVTKTYPSISQKYRETVCTAGLLLNEAEEPQQWIRIYPVRFRNLEFDQQYPRWSIIEAEIERNDKDFRNESYRINDGSIQVIRKIGTHDNWQERKFLIFPFKSFSIQEIKNENKSLGLIKPKKILRYYSKKTERNWSPKQQVVLDQQDLFESSSNLIKIPYRFYYEFIDEDDRKHKYSIIDWEISQLYLKCYKNAVQQGLQEPEQEALDKVKKKLQDDFWVSKDLHFIVGNLKNHKNTFMIIGLFYPKIEEVNQFSLF